MKKVLLIILLSSCFLLTGCFGIENNTKIGLTERKTTKLMLTCRENVTYESGDQEETTVVIDFNMKEGIISSGEFYDVMTFDSYSSYKQAEEEKDDMTHMYCREGNPFALDSDNCFISIDREKMQLSSGIDLEELTYEALGKENSDIVQKDIDKIEDFVKDTYGDDITCKRSKR